MRVCVEVAMMQLGCFSCAVSFVLDDLCVYLHCVCYLATFTLFTVHLTIYHSLNVLLKYLLVLFSSL